MVYELLCKFLKIFGTFWIHNENVLERFVLEESESDVVL